LTEELLGEKGLRHVVSGVRTGSLADKVRGFLAVRVAVVGVGDLEPRRREKLEPPMNADERRF
jgi:hypothetical protein